MLFRNLSERFGSLGETFRGWLKRQVSWASDNPHESDAKPNQGWRLISVFDRNQYEEEVRYYPVSRWFDALQIARLEGGDSRVSLFHIGPLVDGKRRVRFFRIDDSAAEAAANALFWVPESLPLSLNLSEKEILHINNGSFSYYQSATGGQIEGGVIRSPELFALASGVPSGFRLERLDGRARRDRAISQLAFMSVVDWLLLISPRFWQWVSAIGRPLVIFCLALWLAYFVLVSAYLLGSKTFYERRLQALGTEVETLLESQRRLDGLANKQLGYLSLASQRDSLIPMWRGLAGMWGGGAELRSIKWIDGSVTVRGATLDSMRLLTTLREMEGISNPRFSTAIRAERDLQEFTVEFTGDVAERRKGIVR
jgi:hypothetical protein